MKQQGISNLLIDIPAITPDQTVSDVAELFLDKDYKQFLSLPVVVHGQPVGMISRYQLMNIFLKIYGRDVYGKRPVQQFMNPQPLIININQSLEKASHYITENITFPVTEDFIITENEQYCGIGIVLDVLKAMEQQVAMRSKELTKAYNALKSSQAQLVQSEKMASLGQMVAGVAHEINTPLGYVRNNVEMASDVFQRGHEIVRAYDDLLIMMTSEAPEEAMLAQQTELLEELTALYHDEEMFQEMSKMFGDSLFGLDQISELVLSLKDFSRLDQALVANVNLHDCIDSSLTIARNHLKHKIEVKKNYGEIPRIHCSPSQINQVLLNLFTNAAQSIEKTGTIIIGTKSEDEWVNISIQDNGKGIPENILSKIFDPFFTTKPIGQGTGLGLSISYQIIQKHGGKIEVTSKVGEGTCFIISLPARAIADKSDARPELPN